MPLNKKKPIFGKVLIWGLVIIILLLMIVSFPAHQNITEIVLYP